MTRGKSWYIHISWAAFFLVILLSVLLIIACVCLARNEFNHPWSGFSYNRFGGVMRANDTGLVFFDTIVGIENQQFLNPALAGAAIRATVRNTPVGTPLTYQVRRGETVLRVTLPVQSLSWKCLLLDFGMPFLTALGQLCMGVVVFLLRPHTRQSWRFLGFCVLLFSLFATFYDFASTHVFTRFFLFTWYLQSAAFLHLAFVFPEERVLVQRQPWKQWLFYVPSVGLWGLERFLYDVMYLHASHIGVFITNFYTIYWVASLFFLLGSLLETVWRASSPVARCRAQTVFAGFAIGFLLPVGAQSSALLFHINLPLEAFWLLPLALPLSIAYAMLRYNLFNVSALVRRTVTYSVLTVIVIAAYLTLLWVLEKGLQNTVWSQTRSFPVLFGLMVLFVLNPLRERLQHVLDRLFFRTRYNFRQTIETLSQDLTARLDLDDIGHRLVHTVMQALHLSSVALYLEGDHGTYVPLAVAGHAAERLARLRPPRDNPLVRCIAQQQHGLSRYDMEADPDLIRQAPEAPAAFDSLGISLALPLLFKGELIGLLAFGEKLSGAVFTTEDLELLRTLTNQSAVAIANAQAYRALEESNAALRVALRKVEVLEQVKMHLGKFVPAAVRQRIEHNPTAPELDKHDQDTTVLFLDLAGYTRMSETLDQDKVNYLVERYFSSFLDVIYANHGDINETAGDGLMIIFQDEDRTAHARAAVRTAITIRDVAYRINTELAATYPPVTVNMGINSGVAAVGSTKFESAVGTRWTFTASGPVTNLAARIAARATNGAIYIGPETAQRLDNTFRIHSLGPYTFKNVSEPVIIYEVLAAIAVTPDVAIAVGT